MRLHETKILLIVNEQNRQTYFVLLYVFQRVPCSGFVAFTNAVETARWPIVSAIDNCCRQNTEKPNIVRQNSVSSAYKLCVVIHRIPPPPLKQSPLMIVACMRSSASISYTGREGIGLEHYIQIGCNPQTSANYAGRFPSIPLRSKRASFVFATNA